MSFTVAIDYLLISTPKLPGGTVPIPADKTTLGPPKLKRNWHVTEGFGIEGAFCTYTGSGLATFDATFEFWDELKEPLWNQFAAIFLAAPSGRPDVLGIYHPVLILPPFGIQNVVVTELEGWSLVSPGKWQSRVSFLQHKAQRPFKPVKAEPSVPAVQSAAPPKPATAQDLKMANSIAALQYVQQPGVTSLANFKPPNPGF